MVVLGSRPLCQHLRGCARSSCSLSISLMISAFSFQRNPLIAQLADGDVPLSNRVGQTRLQLVRLFALLVSFGRNQLNQPIYDSGLILTLLVGTELVILTGIYMYYDFPKLFLHRTCSSSFIGIPSSTYTCKTALIS